MRSIFRFLPILGAVIGLGGCRTLSSDESDVDIVTLRAIVIVELRGLWWNCSGTLISSNIVYMTASCITDLGGNINHQPLTVTLAIDQMRSRKVEKVFYPPAYLENSNTTSMCGREDYKCAEGCLHNLSEDSEGDLVQDYALLLLEEPFPLCEKNGDAVAAGLDTSPLTKEHEKMIDNSTEECFLIGNRRGANRLRPYPGRTGKQLGIVPHEDFKDTVRTALLYFSCETIPSGFPVRPGYVGILRSVKQFVNEEKPECESKMIEFITVDKSEYITPSSYEHENKNTHCTTNDGKAVQVRFLEILTSTNCPPKGIQTARHASELLAVISAWGEYENYKRSQRRCSTFLEKYPYDSVKEKYLKGSA